jgi:hypothetical protein
VMVMVLLHELVQRQHLCFLMPPSALAPVVDIVLHTLTAIR